MAIPGRFAKRSPGATRCRAQAFGKCESGFAEVPPSRVAARPGYSPGRPVPPRGAGHATREDTMTNTIKALVAASALALSAATSGPARAQVDFEGETVSIIYNAGPGGATGLMAQLLAAHLGSHIPGEPEVIAESVPGGALLKGIIATRAARPDGLTLGWLAWGGATRILDPESLRVDFSQFGMIGGLGNTWVVHAAADAGGGIGTAEEFAALDRITYGGYSTGSSEIRMAATMDTLGIDMDYVGGFRGGAETLAAMRRGEIELRNGTVSNYLSAVVPEMIETGDSVSLFYWGRPTEDGEATSDLLPEDLPTFHDYYVSVRGAPPEGPAYDLIRYLSAVSDGMTWIFVTPPGTPQDITTAYARAYADTMVDPAFLEEARKVLGTVPQTVLRDDAIRIRAMVDEVTPEIRATMQSYIESLTK